MDKNLRKRVTDAIDTARLEKSKVGKFGVAEVVAAVIDQLSLDHPDDWAKIQSQIVTESLTAEVGALMRKSIANAVPRQTWLDLGNFEHLPNFIEVDGKWLALENATLEEYRAYREAFEAKMHSYDYARQSKAKSERDAAIRKEMADFDRKISRYFAGSKDMSIGQAMELHRARLATPSSQHNRAIAKEAISARWARTKNQ